MTTLIDKRRRAGCEVRAIFSLAVEKLMIPGVTAKQVEDSVRAFQKKEGIVSGTIGYHGYEYASCVSVNDEACHGLPVESKVFKAGDVVSVDMVVIHEDIYGDAARSYYITDGPEELIKIRKEPLTPEEALIYHTKRACIQAAALAKPGVSIGTISESISIYAAEHGYGNVTHYGGHYIGKAMHEYPLISNYRNPMFEDHIVQEGDCFCIEPMFTLGGGDVATISDGWTISTIDGSTAAHWEHMVLVTADGRKILA